MDRSTAKRAARFGLGGAALGAILFAMGIAGWLLALALGVDKDTSTTGMAVVAPLYIVVFALSGVTIGLLWRWRERVLGAILVGVAAVSVVIGGCTLLVLYIWFRTQPDRLDVSAFDIVLLAAVVIVSGTLLGLRLRRVA